MRYSYNGVAASTGLPNPEGGVMFDMLSDQMKRDDHLQISNNERLVYWLVVVIVSVLVFGGLYFGIHVLQ